MDEYKHDGVIGDLYSATQVPHAALDRTTYTVESDRKVVGFSCFVHMARAVAAGTPGDAIAIVRVTSFKTGATKDLLRIILASGAIGEQGSLSISPAGLIIQPGDIIKLRTSDASVGGTMSYSLGWTAQLKKL